MHCRLPPTAGTCTCRFVGQSTPPWVKANGCLPGTGLCLKLRDAQWQIWVPQRHLQKKERNNKSVSGLERLFTLWFCHWRRDCAAKSPPHHDFVRFQTPSLPRFKPITFGNKLRTYDMIPKPCYTNDNFSFFYLKLAIFAEMASINKKKCTFCLSTIYESSTGIARTSPANCATRDYVAG